MTFPFYSDSAAESEVSVFDSIREGGNRMSRERFSVKQINNHLREAEVLLAQGMTVGEICRHSPAETSGFRTARLPDARPIPHQPALPGDHGTGRGSADGCDRPAGGPEWPRRLPAYHGTALLRAEGGSVNHKRVARIWRRAGLRIISGPTTAASSQPKRSGFGSVGSM